MSKSRHFDPAGIDSDTFADLVRRAVEWRRLVRCEMTAGRSHRNALRRFKYHLSKAADRIPCRTVFSKLQLHAMCVSLADFALDVTERRD